ncbi:transposable element Tc1 transposase [Trichonephila clavipes]|nr:transposable element Tc1 transposase [Trichonephila clavipes]
MSFRHHIDDFMRGRIIGKIEEGRKITDVAREFDIAHSVVSRLWKSFKTTGMCSRRHEGGRVRNESRFSLSSDCIRQLIWRERGTAYRPENIQEKDRYPTCSIMVWASIMINDRTRLHVVANGTMMGQRYIDEVLLPHVRLFRGAVGDKFVFMDDKATYLNPIENVWDALGRQLAGRNYPPTNRNTLILALTEERDKLPQQLLVNVVQITGTTVLRQTVYRRLGHIGLYARRPVRCIPLNATHCHLQLTWNREHAFWTPQHWSCVMFSDESRFSLQSDSCRTLIWRAPGTRYHQENTTERHRYGGRLGRNYSWFQN